MVEWRLIESGKNPASWNMAVDSAVVESVSKGKSLPTLRLYGWNPSAISIGYFQKLFDEVDVNKCEKNGVDVVRRITGGGAVFHEAEATYSLVIPQSDPLIPGDDIIGCFRRICGGIIRGLDTLGVSASFEPINDVVAGEKKVSGNAQIRRKGCVLQHGTILLNVDVKRMFSLLTVSDEKIRDKMISRVEDRVTSVSDVLGRTVGFDEMIDALRTGFSSEFEVDLHKGSLSDAEKQNLEVFREQKFANQSWIQKR